MSDQDTNTPEAGRVRLLCEEGQALVEYALILMFVSITALTLTPVGETIATRLAEVGAAL
jgi:Flp pilus assembly pilin Flp